MALVIEVCFCNSLPSFSFLLFFSGVLDRDFLFSLSLVFFYFFDLPLSFLRSRESSESSEYFLFFLSFLSLLLSLSFFFLLLSLDFSDDRSFDFLFLILDLDLDSVRDGLAKALSATGKPAMPSYRLRSSYISGSVMCY